MPAGPRTTRIRTARSRFSSCWRLRSSARVSASLFDALGAGTGPRPPERSVSNPDADSSLSNAPARSWSGSVAAAVWSVSWMRRSCSGESVTPISPAASRAAPSSFCIASRCACIVSRSSSPPPPCICALRARRVASTSWSTVGAARRPSWLTTQRDAVGLRRAATRRASSASPFSRSWRTRASRAWTNSSGGTWERGFWVAIRRNLPEGAAHWSVRSRRLLEPEGLDGIQPRGAQSGIEARDDARQAGRQHGAEHHRWREQRGPVALGGHPLGDADPQAEADHAAHGGEQHRLGEELEEDVPAAAAHRHADADLARAFGDRHQHHVGDADTADDQRDRRHCLEQRGQGLGALLRRVLHLGEVADLEVGLRLIGPAVALPEQRGDLAFGVAHLL